MTPFLEKAEEAASNPDLAKIALGRRTNRFYHTRGHRRKGYPGGVDIFSEDWDNLIILDACRYDYLSEYDFRFEIESKYSQASSTREFVTLNFMNRKLMDLVYISANFWYPRLRSRINSRIHRFVNLQKEEFQDPSLGVELPETVAEMALDTQDKFPRKRLLIHFIQPHYPYIGSVGRSVFEPKTNMTKSVLNAGVDPEVLRTAYRENLDEVVPVVKDLVTELNGKTIVTADHGELLGERSAPLPYVEYGHPKSTYIEKLVKIPWIVFNDGSRKDIIPSQTSDRNRLDDSTIDERLKHLGYAV